MRKMKKGLSLLLCLSLLLTALPMQVYAASDLDLVDKYTDSETSGGNLDVDGYHWEKDTSKMEFTLQLKNAKIGGDLILPVLAAYNEISLNIILDGKNEITGDIHTRIPDELGSYTDNYKMRISGNGELYVNGTIFGTGNNDDTITVSGGAKVAVSSINMGASGFQDSYVVVEGENSQLTIEQKLTLEGIEVKDGGSVIANGGIELINSSKIVVDAKSTIDITGNPALQAADRDMLDYLKKLDDDGFLPQGYYIYENGSDVVYDDKDIPATNIKIGKYFDIKVTGGTASRSQAIYGTEITLTPDAAPEGKQFDGWTITPNVTVTGNKFNMPASDVTIAAAFKDASGTGEGGSEGNTPENNTPSKKYDIEVDETKGVSIDVAEKAKKNVAVNMEVTVEDGYELKGIIVTDASGEELTVRDKGDGVYQFTMPRKDVTVKAIVEEIEEKYILLTIDELEAWVFDAWVTNDVAPVIRNERTMLPIRFVVEALGGNVAWDEATQTVSIVKDDIKMEIYIGQSFALVNGAPVQLDSPAFIENGRTYLPLRFVAENLDAEVIWNGAAQTVKIIPGK